MLRFNKATGTNLGQLCTLDSWTGQGLIEDGDVGRDRAGNGRTGTCMNNMSVCLYTGVVTRLYTENQRKS